MNRTVDFKASAREVQHHSRRLAASPWVERAVRLGYVARGVLYGLAGVLSLLFALGIGGQAASQQDAIVTIARQPFGSILLVLIALGLAGYSAWGVIRAVLDPLDKGTDAKGVAQRIGYLVSAVSYASLLVLTVQVLGISRLPLDVAQGGPQAGSVLQAAAKPASGAQGTGTQQGGSSAAGQQPASGTETRAQDWTAWLLRKPFGAWIVALGGLAMIGAGLGELLKAITASFAKHFDRARMSATELELAERLGRAGHAARAVVFGLIGLFLIKAAWQANPAAAHGFGGALAELLRQTFGPPLLALVALGLVLFGVFSALNGRWMQIDVASNGAGHARTPQAHQDSSQHHLHQAA